MPDYSVFGGCLRSELAFPDDDAGTRWHATIGRCAWERFPETVTQKSSPMPSLPDLSHPPQSRRRLVPILSFLHRLLRSVCGRPRILFEPAAHGDLDGARADFISRGCLTALITLRSRGFAAARSASRGARLLFWDRRPPESRLSRWRLREGERPTFASDTLQ